MDKHDQQLDGLRGFAALYVVLHHVFLQLRYSHPQLSLLWQFFRYGPEAVIIFFILSGYVIGNSYSSRIGRSISWQSYLQKRTRRIFPIFFVALILSYAVASLLAGKMVPCNSIQLFGNILMLQSPKMHPGHIINVYYYNGPLWSLSFEWWFYMLFYPIQRFIPGRNRIFVVMGICMTGMILNLVYMNQIFWIMVFLPIWWMGVEIARVRSMWNSFMLRDLKLSILSVCLPLVGFFILSLRIGLHHLDMHIYPASDFRLFLAALGLLFLAWIWTLCGLWGYDQTIGKLSILAPVSYGIYAFHYPLLSNLSTWPSHSIPVNLPLRAGAILLLA